MVMDRLNIKEALDRAETYDGSGEIDWSEVSVQTIFDFARINNLLTMDIESVQGIMLERWQLLND